VPPPFLIYPIPKTVAIILLIFIITFLPARPDLPVTRQIFQTLIINFYLRIFLISLKEIVIKKKKCKLFVCLLRASKPTFFINF
jgi:hypothetical protein